MGSLHSSSACAGAVKKVRLKHAPKNNAIFRKADLVFITYSMFTVSGRSAAGADFLAVVLRWKPLFSTELQLR
jgi:hypothetical protein